MKIKVMIILLFCSFYAFGAENNPVLMGSSNSSGIMLSGIDAVGNNPANLGLSAKESGSLSCILMPNISFSLESSLPISVYNDYMSVDGDNDWSPADKKDILSYLEDRWRIRQNTGIDIFSISIENTAVFFTAGTVESISIPEDLLELQINGNEIGTKYDADELDAEMFCSVSIGVSYGQKIENEWLNRYFREFSVGGSFRLIHSLPFPGEIDDPDENSEAKISPAYIKVKNLDSYVIANDLTGSGSPGTGATVVKGTFEVQMSEAGMGFGTDIGVAGVINDRMKIGLSVRDLFSYINWYKTNRVYKYSYIMDGLTFSDLEGDENDSLLTEDQSTEEKDFGTLLPPELRLEYLWELRNGDHNFFWTSSYIQGFYNELNTTVIPKFSTGCEWYHNSADWLRLRSGITAGGETYFSSAAGFSIIIKKYVLDLAVKNEYLFGDSSKGLSIALGQKIVW